MKNTNSKKWILTDCDGVWLDRTRERIEGINTHEDYIDLLNELLLFKNQGGYEFVALTDRGTAQLPVITYLLQGSKFQIGESGAAAYNSLSHSVTINPAFYETVKQIKTIAQEFENRFGFRFSLEPGVYSSIRVERHNTDDLSPAFDFLTRAANRSTNLICCDHGDCISLKPASINKHVGIDWMASLYKSEGNPIDFKNSVWIGDGDSDIPAAKYVKKNGGIIAAVSNAQAGYKEFIQSNNGYFAKNEKAKGMIEILRHFRG